MWTSVHVYMSHIFIRSRRCDLVLHTYTFACLRPFYMDTIMVAIVCQNGFTWPEHCLLGTQGLSVM